MTNQDEATCICGHLATDHGSVNHNAPMPDESFPGCNECDCPEADFTPSPAPAMQDAGGRRRHPEGQLPDLAGMPPAPVTQAPPATSAGEDWRDWQKLVADLQQQLATLTTERDELLKLKGRVGPDPDMVRMTKVAWDDYRALEAQNATLAGKALSELRREITHGGLYLQPHARDKLTDFIDAQIAALDTPKAQQGSTGGGEE